MSGDGRPGTATHEVRADALVGAHTRIVHLAESESESEFLFAVALTGLIPLPAGAC